MSRKVRATNLSRKSLQVIVKDLSYLYILNSHGQTFGQVFATVYYLYGNWEGRSVRETCFSKPQQSFEPWALTLRLLG